MRKMMLGAAAPMLFVVALGACGSSSKSAAPATTVPPATAAVAPTTGAQATTVPTAPCGGVEAVTAGVKATKTAGFASAEQYDVINIKVASADPSWAFFNYAYKPAFERQGGYGVVHCEQGAWVVVDYGTDEVGCAPGDAPGPSKAVRQELKLHCAKDA